MPVAASASIGGGLTIDLTFRGACDVGGFLKVDNPTGGFVVFEHPYDWSANQKIHQEIGSTPIADPGDRLVLRLIASDHQTILFRSDSFPHHGDESARIYEFRATLDCSRIPYQIVMSDSAVAPPRPMSWMTMLGLTGLFAAVVLASVARRRRMLRAS
jgi:hypothetical protein